VYYRQVHTLSLDLTCPPRINLRNSDRHSYWSTFTGRRAKGAADEARQRGRKMEQPEDRPGEGKGRKEDMMSRHRYTPERPKGQR
jgi:hypothetical protein